MSGGKGEYNSTSSCSLNTISHHLGDACSRETEAQKESEAGSGTLEGTKAEASRDTKDFGKMLGLEQLERP